jgi:hypothetical protein
MFSEYSMRAGGVVNVYLGRCFRVVIVILKKVRALFT